MRHPELVRGEPAVAVAFLERCMEQLGDSHIEAAPTLAMLVDAHIASGKLLQRVWGPIYGEESQYLRVFIRQLR